LQYSYNLEGAVTLPAGHRETGLAPSFKSDFVCICRSLRQIGIKCKIVSEKQSTEPLSGQLLLTGHLNLGEMFIQALFGVFDVMDCFLQYYAKMALRFSLAWICRARAAKAIYHFGQAVKLSAHQAEERRQKTIKDAESMLRTEQGRRKLTPSASLPDNAGSSTHQNTQFPTHPDSQNELFTSPSAPPYGNHIEHPQASDPSYHNQP
jgi:hypothetical protein